MKGKIEQKTINDATTKKTRRGVYYNKKGKQLKMQMKRRKKYCKNTGMQPHRIKGKQWQSVDEKRLQINLIVILPCGCS